MPLETLEDYLAEVLPMAIRIDDYIDAPKKNYVGVGGVLAELMHRRSDYCLSAASYHARNFFVPIVMRHVETAEIAGPLYMVSFAFRRYVMPEGTAHTFTPEPLHTEIRGILKRHSYIGVTEAAYYPNWVTTDDGTFSPVVSYHSHVITSGSSRKTLVRDTAEAAGEESLLRGVSAVDIREVKRERLTEKLLYILKPSHKQYTPYWSKTDKVRVQLGLTPKGTVKQSKKAMRTGLLVQMCNVLRDQRLDELIFGNGAFEPLVQTIVQDARGTLDRRLQRESDRRPR
ncbi:MULTISPECIES: hypothetical protein [unclassified Devosia]|uniref:hypothetical protein n=1 Tax=unclassified Devosia TaxID=196773 RepID=UPI00086EC4E1|nr:MULTISPECIES: hypothetical protein [unclassified Devosia]MBN9360837.1 hypothetical protein [Devosia sp.]ODS88184.1 MAG: hypothetical protein ABS47_10545 [Devosia sp. SCN 66-27]OJX22789.1 MAG: hypothetical protein BGO83_18610 [Devosia sp. 66-14]